MCFWGKSKKMQNLTTSEIEKLVIDYLKKHKGKTVYPVDIANHYNIDDGYRVFKITEKMIKKGLIEYDDKGEKYIMEMIKKNE